MSYAPIPASTSEGTVTWGPDKAFTTWYRITGFLPANANSDTKPPVIVLHGGPGAGHDYVLSMADLADTDRAVIHYDQLGCGKSTRLPERAGDKEFWTLKLFVSELSALIKHLELRQYYIIGQSGGGFIAYSFLVTHPRGLLGAVLADTAPSSTDYMNACKWWLAQTPALEAIISKHESEGTTEAWEYMDALDRFFLEHGCRKRPIPKEVVQSGRNSSEDTTVYKTMNGVCGPGSLSGSI